MSGATTGVAAVFGPVGYPSDGPLAPEQKFDLFSTPTYPSSSAPFSQLELHQSATIGTIAHSPPLLYSPTPGSPASSQSRKRKRAILPFPGDNCSVCSGSEQRNGEGVKERLLSCHKCGKSSHPSCLNKPDIFDQAQNWDWTCDNCKTCEACDLKNSETKPLSCCRRCDRGWHLSCLATSGSFELSDYCPTCHLHLAESTASRSTSLHAPETIVITDHETETADQPFTQLSSHSRQMSKSKKVKTRPRQSILPHELPHTTKQAFSRGTASRPRISLKIPPRGQKSVEVPQSSPKRRAFEEILKPEEADTSNTAIQSDDKIKFEKSKSTAESRLGVPLVPPPGTPAGIATPQPEKDTTTKTPGMSSLPSFLNPHIHKHLLDVTPRKQPAIDPHAEPGALPPRIRTIRIGKHEVDTWYDAPFPEEYAAVPKGKLYMCEFCLKYIKSPFGAARHRMKCIMRHPPGDEVYRDGHVSIFEVDGRLNKIYCQNLCLLSKMFLDHKSLFYDVEPFLFYVMTEVDEGGAHFVGYFSKEKKSPKDYNVSCIMTLPVKQKSGWGNLLIDFSYLLTQREGRYGTPERPLSKLGAIAYGRYWQLAVFKYLKTAPEGIRMEDICRHTRMTIEDVFNTLRIHNMISLSSEATGSRISSPSKSGAGSARPPGSLKLTNKQKNEIYDLTTLPTEYSIQWDRKLVRDYVTTIEKKGLAKLKPDGLRWSPYLVTRLNKAVEEEPSMSNDTPIEPIPTELRKFEETKKSPMKRRERRRTPDYEEQLLLEDWIPDIDEDDDDESFLEDDSPSPRRKSRRMPTRRSKTVTEEEEEEDWDETIRHTRYRGRRVLSADSGSDWEEARPSTRTRRRTKTTSPEMVAESPEILALSDVESPEILSVPLPDNRKKRIQSRVISTPTDSGDEEEQETRTNGLHPTSQSTRLDTTDVSHSRAGAVLPTNGAVVPSKPSESSDVEMKESSELQPKIAGNASSIYHDIEMCDEDAEGEDEDAEGEEDPFY